jgi:hypothetical protein
MHAVFQLENLQKRDHLGNLGMDRRIIILELVYGVDMDWIYLAEDNVW